MDKYRCTWATRDSWQPPLSPAFWSDVAAATCRSLQTPERRCWWPEVPAPTLTSPGHFGFAPREGCIKDSTAKLVNLVTLEALMKQQTQWKSVDHRDAQVPWPHCRNIQGFPFQSSHWIRVWEEGVTNARHHQQKATRPARKGEKLIHGDPQNSDFLGNKIHLRPYHRFMLGLLGDLRNSMQFHVGFRGCIWKIYVLASDYGSTTRWILDNCHICKAEQGTGWSMTTRTRHLWRTRSWAPYWVWRLGFHNIPYIRFPKNIDVDSKIVKLSPTYSFKLSSKLQTYLADASNTSISRFFWPGCGCHKDFLGTGQPGKDREGTLRTSSNIIQGILFWNPWPLIIFDHVNPFGVVSCS